MSYLSVSKKALANPLFLALAVLVAAGLTGCGAGQNKTAAAPGKTGKTTEETAAAAGMDDSLARVKKAGVLLWGADSGGGGAPYVYTLTDPKTQTESVIGWEVDLMKKLAAHLGVEYKIVPVDWKNLIPDLVEAKRSDLIMNGLEITEGNSKRIDFSKPYCVYAQQITVRAEDKDKVKTLADLKGKKIGTLSGAESNKVLERSGFTEEQIVPYEDSNTPYVTLKNKKDDRVQAVLQEDMIADFYAGKETELYNVPATFSPGKYGVAFRKEDKTLREEVDRILQLMKDNGELAEIYKKWNIWNNLQKEIGVKEK